jgi:hypothetical protein
MKSSILFVVLTITVCLLLLFAHNTKAQDTTRRPGIDGYTSIDYDPDTNIVTGYSETILTDYSLESDYEPQVLLYISTGSYPPQYVAYGRGYSDGYDGASITIDVSGDPSTTYTASGTHRLRATLYDDYAINNYPYVYNYYDNYYFGSYEGQGIDVPWYYFFASPFYSTILRRNEYISMGGTHDSASVTTPNEADHLQIVNDEFETLPVCDRLQRNITYRIVDIKGHGVFSVEGNFIRESDSNVPDSCNGQIPKYNKECGGFPGSTFTDHLNAACPANGDYDCGYDIPDEQWLSCRANGTFVPLATLDYNVRHARIIVSGYSTPIPQGYMIRRNRSILPPN